MHACRAKHNPEGTILAVLVELYISLRCHLINAKRTLAQYKARPAGHTY